MFDLPALITLGASVGFAAGLLGVGGGGIMVPILTSMFLLHLGENHAVHVALGTSMASIVVTSLSSFLAHHKRGAVDWSIVKSMTPGILLGTYIATYFVALLDGVLLAGFFACFMLFVAIQMLSNARPNASRSLPGKIQMATTGAGIGSVSAMVSIGGGSLSVPYMYWHNVPLHTAVGTSAALGFPIALAGTLGYLIHGANDGQSIDGVFGFIYLPGVITISLVSILTAPLGAKLAHNVPVKLIKKIFGVLLFALSIKMFVAVVV